MRPATTRSGLRYLNQAGDVLRTGIWKDTRTDSPVSVQRLGAHVVLAEDKQVDTPPAQVDADAAAAAIGRRAGGRARSPSIRHVARPWLEPGDTVQVTYAGGPTEAQLIDSVEIPLDNIEHPGHGPADPRLPDGSARMTGTDIPRDSAGRVIRPRPSQLLADVMEKLGPDHLTTRTLMAALIERDRGAGVEPRAVTPKFGWHIPVLADPPNVPYDMQENSLDIEATLSGVRVQASAAITNGSGAGAVTFPVPFPAVPAVVLTVLGQPGMAYLSASPTATGFTCNLVSHTGTALASTYFHWVAVTGGLTSTAHPADGA